MSSFMGVIVSDPWLQSQFTQVKLRCLETKFISLRSQLGGKVTLGDLPPVMMKLKALGEVFTEVEIAGILSESTPDATDEVDFEAFLRAQM